MMRRIKVGIVIVILAALVAVVGAANAVTLVSTPTSVVIPVGGYATTTVSMSDTASGTYILKVNTTTPNVLVSIDGPYLDPAFTKPITGATTVTPYGELEEVTWAGTANTQYYFRVVYTSNVPNVNVAAGITGVVVNFASSTINVNVITSYLSVTPELLTLALVGAGAVAVVLLRRRGF